MLTILLIDSRLSNIAAVTKCVRLTASIGLACGLLLAGCAHQGTVVRKEFRPLPFLYSLGLEGIYRFELRDRAGHIHDQMVNANVFANYEVGDYFNDLAAPPSGGGTPTGPEPMIIPAPRRPLQEYGTPYRSAKIGRATQDETHPAKVARSRRPHPRTASRGEDNVAGAFYRYSVGLRM